MSALDPPEKQNRADRSHAVFEQPLNERMRNFLRLEFLYRQATHTMRRRAHGLLAPQSLAS